jgi:hypothetical protein
MSDLVFPDFFMSEKECIEASKKKFNLNERYPQLTQSIFTAGDINQFETFRKSYYIDENLNNENTFSTENIWKSIYSPFDEWKKYKNLTTESVNNTFQYIFNKFKKGIFIKIVNNNLEVFLPFSNLNYKNEWSNKIGFDTSRFKSLEEFLIFSSHKQGYTYINSNNINKNPETFYANNCLIRYEYPIAENNKGVSAIRDMLLNLCKTRKVPDIELFINKRDFPIIKRDESEPYEQIYGEKYKLISHRYESYCPILSPVTTSFNSDIAFPTAEDWARASSQEDKKFFPGFCRNYNYDFNTKWEDKIPTAIFRGSSTGCGVTIETNPRLKISYLSSISPTEDGHKLLDAGITKWNLRPRKIINQKNLQMIEPQKILEAKEMNVEDQSKYKYIVNVDGHVSAFRLSLEMSMGSVILLVKSKYNMWFKKYLVEYVHYVPIEEDLSDLFEKIRWCRKNDSQCKKISENSFEFYNTFLKKKGILDFIQELFYNIKNETGEYFYNSIKVSDIIQKMELKVINSDVAKNLGNQKLFFPNISIENQSDRFYWLEGTRLFLERNKSNFDLGKKIYTNKLKNVFVSEASINNSKNLFVIKNTNKYNDLVNELFVGKILNNVIREIPNFRYTYCAIDNNQIVLENVVGETFQNYIQNGCSIEKFNEILLIICLALSVAQEKYGFVHFDLYPWNIIIKKIPKQKIYYQFKEHCFTVETDTIPVIIDYGKSNVQYNGMHYGTLKPFEMNTIQDFYCVIISGVYEIFKRYIKLSENDKKYLIYIMSFFDDNLKNENDLLKFVSQNKKFNEMIYGDKCVIKSKTPFEVFLHLSEMDITIDISQITYPEKPNYPFPLSNPQFYYEILCKIDPLPSIYEYLTKIYRTYEILLYESKNPLSFINTCNYIYTVLVFTRNLIKNLPIYFGAESPQSIKIIKLIKDIKNSNIIINENLKIEDKKAIHSLSIINKLLNDYLPNKYNFYIDEIKDNKNLLLKIQNINPNKKVLPSMYTPQTFSIPSKILTIIQGDIEKQNLDLLVFRDMYVFNILFEMPYKLKNEMETALDYKNIILISPLVLCTHNANINTVKYISKILYKADLKKIKKRTDSKQLDKVVRVMENILIS